MPKLTESTVSYESKQPFAALDNYGLIDGSQEAAFDELSCFAAKISDSPVALITLIDGRQHIVKAAHGLDQEISEAALFFSRQVTASDSPLLIVADATVAPEFTGQNLNHGALRLRLLVGLPLKTSQNQIVGALCVLSHEARELTADQRDALGMVARQVMAQLNLRLSLNQTLLSRVRLENSQRIAGLGDWEHDVSTQQFQWSDEVYHILGLQRQTAPADGNNFYDRVHPQDLAFVQERIFASRNQHRNEFEHRIVRPDGAVRHIHHITEMVFDDHGQLVRESGTIQDITDRKIAAGALHQSEERYRKMFERNPSPVWIFDEVTLAFLAVNDASMMLFGYTREEFLQMKVPSITLPEASAFSGDGGRSSVAPFQESGRFNYRKKDGTQIALEIFAHGIDFAGRPARFVLALDMTQASSDAEALRSSEARFRALSESAPLGIFECDANGRVIYYNPALIALSGRPVADSLGHGWDQNIHPEDRAAMSAGWARAAAEGIAWNQEPRLLRSDGSVRWVHTLTAPSRNAEGQVTGFIGTVEDITEHRAAEIAMLESEERHRKMLMLSPDAHFVNVGGKITFVNHAFCELMSATDPAQLIGQPALGIIHPDHQAQVHERQQLLSIDEPTPPSEMKFVRLDGTTVDVEVASVAFDFRGRQEIQVIARNITARKLAVTALRESEERFKFVARAVSDVVWDWDLIAKTLWWNDGFLTTFGFVAGEIEPSPESWIGRIHAEDRDKVVKTMETAMASTAESWQAEYRVQRKNGSHALVYDRGYILRDSSGQAIRIVGGMRDLTEQKKMEAQYLRAQRMESIGTLAGGISHDLNNVLAPIMMSIELLQMNSQTDARSQRILETIYLSCRRGADLVKQVLSFARGIEGERVAIRLRTLIDDLEAIIGETFPRNIQIVSDVAINLWPVSGDPTQLHQVLLNLAVNARDAMPRGGVLTLTATNLMLDAQYVGATPDAKPGSYVLIQVTDTGHGIPAEVRDRIFEPFFTTKELGKGTGIGLATVHTAVKSHGGFLLVESEVGRGTTFKVFLPADEIHRAAVSIPPFKIQPPRGRDELVLIIDDEAAIRDITRQTLEEFGYRVITATDGPEAIALYAVQSREIALVLTDMMMPVLDGAATIQVLKRINPEIKIIAASGLEVNENIGKATRAGVPDFLAKPFTAETLLSRIREVLDRPVVMKP